MQLKEVKISNILSFPYCKDFKSKESNSFSIDGSCGQMAILIGDNASGKTNFLKIIEEFYANFVVNFSYHKQYLSQGTDNHQQVIQQGENKTKNLETNYNTPDLDAYVEITFKLSVLDFENIGFVCRYPDEINGIIQKYSDLNILFEKEDIEYLMDHYSTIQILAKFDEKQQTFLIDESNLDEKEKFMIKVLRHHQLLQIIIAIFNEVEKKSTERKWYLLKNTFTVLGNDRTNLVFENFIDPVQLMENNYGYRNSLDGYINFVYKIWSILEDFSQEQLLSSPFLIEDALDDSMQYLRNSDFFVEINFLIKKYFNKEITVDYINGVMDVKLIDHHGKVVYLEDLSDGEQSLLSLVFGFYGNDLDNGCMIIHEPELHIHPYIQKGLVKIFQELSEKKGTQFIMSTNSPLLISDKNITNVYRVFKSVEKGTQIIAPKIMVDADDTKLMHMLKFDNISKIFFAQKIILVEGDTDAYFFSYYLDYLSKRPEWADKIIDFEIININGKGGFKPWRKFLDKFKIQNYFIGDRDNTVDYGFFSKAEINRYYQIANQQKQHQKRQQKSVTNPSNTDYYNKLVKTIMTFNPGKHKIIIQGIERLYHDRVFILKEGAIESYVPLEKKGFPFMVWFCNNAFEDRLTDPYYQNQRSELNRIIEIIFGK